MPRIKNPSSQPRIVVKMNEGQQRSIRIAAAMQSPPMSPPEYVLHVAFAAALDYIKNGPVQEVGIVEKASDARSHE